jgi:hypothetical protein
MKTIMAKNGTKIKVSNEDFEYLNQFTWYSIRNEYFYRNDKHTYEYKNGNFFLKRVTMHREVLERKLGTILESNIRPDHKNLDTLDNTRENLRPATTSQNNANCKPRNGRLYKGVYSYELPSGTFGYRARIKNNGKLKSLGNYDNELDAAMAYDKEAYKQWGEYARLNVLSSFQLQGVVIEEVPAFYQDFISKFKQLTNI